MMRNLLAWLLVAVVSWSSCAPVPKFAGPGMGRFIGRVLAEWDTKDESMTLREDFAYFDPSGVVWDAPAGSRIDGASIPRWAWPLVGDPFGPGYRSASVVHDVACVRKNRNWKDVHRAFYAAMRAGGVKGIKAKVMFAAVYHFGPRWPVPRVENTCTELPDGRKCIDVVVVDAPPPPSITREEFDELRAEIENVRLPNLGVVAPFDGPMTLQDIEDFVPSTRKKKP